MTIYGGIHFNGDGTSATVSAMNLIQQVVNLHQDNVVGYNKIGYQKKIPVISSFAEYIGAHAVSVNKDEEIGKIQLTSNPLDFALGCKGYFQIQTASGIELTRDGRFKLDKDGFLLNLEDNKVLSKEGVPIQFKQIPENIKDITIRKDGTLQFKDSQNLKIHTVGTLSVVSSEGSQVEEVNVKQGYTEHSNVTIYEEVYDIMPLRRALSVNTDLFKIQNEALSKVLQELGRA